MQWAKFINIFIEYIEFNKNYSSHLWYVLQARYFNGINLKREALICINKCNSNRHTEVEKKNILKYAYKKNTYKYTYLQHINIKVHIYKYTYKNSWKGN